MLAAALNWMIGCASPGGRHGRLSVLIFHRVQARRDELLPDEPTASEFEAQLLWLRRGFNVIPLEQGIDGLVRGSLPPRAAAITFDDGYANNYTVALPILQRQALHATFFVSTGYLDGGRMFNDTVIESVRAAPGAELDLGHLGLGTVDISDAEARRRVIDSILGAVKYLDHTRREQAVKRLSEVCGGRLPTDLMMSAEQVAAIADAGMGVGGHTVSHPILSSLADDEARDEIRRGRDRLREICRREISLFAYPNGRPNRDYSARSVRLVRELGFKGAVTTSRGAAAIGSDPFQVPRFSPWTRQPRQATAQMLRNLLTRAEVAAA